MKKIFVLSFVAMIGLTSLQAQTPLNTFNKRTLFKYWDPEGTASLQQTTDRGYISGRMAYDSVGTHAYRYFDFVRRDREGNTSWIKRILMGDYGYLHIMVPSASAIQTNDGGYMGAMMAYKDSTIGEIVLLKTDSVANLTWAKKYPGELGTSPFQVLQTSDNGYIVAGYTQDSNRVQSAFIFKTDASGNYLWGKKCLAPGDSSGGFYALRELQGQGYVACGYSGGHAMVVKFDQNGNMNWNKHFFTKGAAFYTVTQGSDGHLLVGGSYLDTTSSRSRLCLLKTDTAGNISWFKGYDQNPNPYYGSTLMALVPLQGYVAYAGYISDPIPGTLIGKMDLAGNFMWTQKYISTYHTFGDCPMSLVATTDGGYALDEFVGTFLNGSSNYSKELMKVDSIGGGACDGANHLITMAPLSFPPSSNVIASSSGSAFSYTTAIVNATFTDSVVCETINDVAPVGIRAYSNQDLALLQNFPNPFSFETTIVYSLSNEGKAVTLEVINSLGVKVYEQKQTAASGEHRIQLRNLPSGIYFYSLKVDGQKITRKMLVE